MCRYRRYLWAQVYHRIFSHHPLIRKLNSLSGHCHGIGYLHLSLVVWFWHKIEYFYICCMIVLGTALFRSNKCMSFTQDPNLILEKINKYKYKCFVSMWTASHFGLKINDHSVYKACEQFKTYRLIILYCKRAQTYLHFILSLNCMKFCRNILNWLINTF